MKKTLLCFGLIAAAAGLKAQTYFFDDFSSGTLSNWNVTDSDGDGNNWGIADYDDGVQEEHASSASWISTPLTPNNWMVSDPIDLSTASGTILLEWLVYGQDQLYAGEHYTVYVATSNVIATLQASPTNFTETLTTSAGYMSRSLDVSTFAGQTIYIGFRHHAVTDMFKINVDDVEVSTALANDAEMVSLDIDPVILAGNYTIAGTIFNNGLNSITSYDITWDSGSGPQTQSFTNTILSGATYNFSHSTQLVVVAGTDYNIDVCVDLTGDGDAANDCITASTSGASQTGTRLPLMEEFSSSTCPPCFTLNTTGFGGVGMNTYLAGQDANESGANLAVIKYQVNWPGSGDHAYNNDVSSRVNYYNVSAAPTVLVDAIEIGTPAAITAAAAVPAFLDISATHSSTGGVVTVNVSVNPYADWTGAKLHIALLDKEYAAGTAPSFSNGETEFHHILRKMIPSGNGTTINLNAGTPYTSNQNYSYNFFNGWPAQGSFDLHAASTQEVVVFIQDADGNLLNSAISIGTIVGVEEENTNSTILSVYPNPSTDLTNVQFSLDETSNVSIEVVNALGQVLYANNLGNVIGTQKVQINTVNFEAGMYLINVIVDGVVSTKRVSVVK